MEKRTLVIEGAELRAEADFCIVGKALTYNKPSPDDQLAPGMREQITPGCFRESLANGDEVKALKNHNPDVVLGRLANKTLTLTDGPDALRFRVQLDKNRQDHKDVYASVLRKDLTECSFAFITQSQRYIDDTDSKGNPCRTRCVDKATLLDVSIVCYPFYSDPGSTSAEARAAALKVQATHGLKDAIKILRRAAASCARDFRRLLRSEDDQVDFASHLDRCHQYGEFLVSQLDQARDVLESPSPDDDDDVDDLTRSTFHVARAAAAVNCEQLAMARLYHARAKDKKKGKK